MVVALYIIILIFLRFRIQNIIIIISLLCYRELRGTKHKKNRKYKRSGFVQNKLNIDFEQNLFYIRTY